MGRRGKGGGSAHDRAMARAAAAKPHSSPLPPVQPPVQSSVTRQERFEALVAFLEHPWVLIVVGTLGGIVGLIYTPVLFIAVACFVAAFHRNKRMVAEVAWPLQASAYLFVALLATTLVYGTIVVIRREIHVPTADEIAQKIKELNAPRERAEFSKPEEHPLTAHTPANPIVPSAEPKYPPPKGPGVREDFQAVPPSNQMCLGLAGQERINCLCPNPLRYSLKALPAPSDNNYSTEVNVKAATVPFYRIRVFARTQMNARYGYTTVPPFKNGNFAAFLGTFDYDPYSFVFNVTKPVREFKIEVHSSEGLRLYCVNEIN